MTGRELYEINAEQAVRWGLPPLEPWDSLPWHWRERYEDLAVEVAAADNEEIV